MRINIDKGWVTLTAKNEAEARLFGPIQEAINAEVDVPFPAQIGDLIRGDLPGGGILNGILVLQAGAEFNLIGGRRDEGKMSKAKTTMSEQLPFNWRKQGMGVPNPESIARYYFQVDDPQQKECRELVQAAIAAELEVAKLDKARMDWLESRHETLITHDGQNKWWIEESKGCATARAAIDAERTRESTGG